MNAAWTTANSPIRSRLHGWFQGGCRRASTSPTSSGDEPELTGCGSEGRRGASDLPQRPVLRRRQPRWSDGRARRAAVIGAGAMSPSASGQGSGACSPVGQSRRIRCGERPGTRSITSILNIWDRTCVTAHRDAGRLSTCSDSGPRTPITRAGDPPPPPAAAGGCAVASCADTRRTTGTWCRPATTTSSARHR